MADADDLLDIKQAAELLHVSEASLRRWTNAGTLACLRVGAKRERRFRRADLLAFLEEQPVRGRPSETPAVAQGQHLCALYADDAGRTKLAVGFLADGLRLGNACHLVDTPEATRVVLAQLAPRHPALQADLDTGRLVVSEYLDSGPAELARLEAGFAASLAAGMRSIRLVGNISDGRISRGKPFADVLAFEEAYDRRLARRFPLRTLCQYDARQHSGVDLAAVLKRHRDVFRYPPDVLIA